MNLEQIKNQTPAPAAIDDIEFDFKPITSGLGFHQKAADVKPAFTERTLPPVPSVPVQPALQKEMNVYQNDLSIFYNQAQPPGAVEPEVKIEEVKYFKTAGSAPRLFAYITDLFFLASILALVLIVMARTISMDIMEVWSQYPNEITPLVLTLFCGFYLIYFSIFEKMGQSTLGKNLFGLRVTGTDNAPLSLFSLVARTSISLLNFISLGLFSYFDLQNKITSSKVIRID